MVSRSMNYFITYLAKYPLDLPFEKNVIYNILYIFTSRNVKSLPVNNVPQIQPLIFQFLSIKYSSWYQRRQEYYRYYQLWTASNESMILHSIFQDLVNTFHSSSSKCKHRRSITLYFTRKIHTMIKLRTKIYQLAGGNPDVYKCRSN